MRRHEEIAQKDGNLLGGKQPPTETLAIHENPRARAIDLIAPVALLVTSVFLGFLYDGGFFLFGGQHGFAQALQHATHTAQVLLTAGIFTFIASVIIALMRQVIAPQLVSKIVVEGFSFIYSSILMIFLAATLGKFLKVDLLTGNYLASLLLGSFPAWAVPVMFFVVATIIAFVTGSSWGTIALTAPMATQIVTVFASGIAPFALADLPLLLPVIGALFAGAICGNHISPISDTTMLASASCGTYPLDHVYTQLPYALPAIIGTALAFVATGFLVPYGKAIMLGGSLAIGCMVTIALLWLGQKLLRA
jgi:Na+/H+ antiporter NhaC